MSDQWYYARENQQQGPVPFDEVRRLAADGSLKPADLVWTPAMANWQPAGGVAGLFPPAAGGQPPPMAVRPPPHLPPGHAVQPGHAPGHAPLGYAGPGPYGPPPPGIGQDPGMRWLLPVGRSGWAIAAGYFGLLSIIPIFAPIALILGIVAIVDIRKHPDRHGMGRAIFGLVMGALFSLGLVFFLLAGAAGRNF